MGEKALVPNRSEMVLMIASQLGLPQDRQHLFNPTYTLLVASAAGAMGDFQAKDRTCFVLLTSALVRSFLLGISFI
jgi:hypothetical protein